MAEAQPEADDQTIQGNVSLWRRVPKTPSHCVYDENLNRMRATSAAFKDHPNGSPMSVTIDVGQDPTTAIKNYPNNGLAAVTTELVRSLGQTVRRSPVHDDPNHAEVVGPKPKRVSSEMAKASVWIIHPPP